MRRRGEKVNHPESPDVLTLSAPPSSLFFVLLARAMRQIPDCPSSDLREPAIEIAIKFVHVGCRAAKPDVPIRPDQKKQGLT